MARSRSSSSSSRSLSPYNKRNRPPRRSRSTDRRRSNRGRRSSPRRSRSHSRRRDGHSFVRRRSPRRFTRRSLSPRARRRSRSRQRKSPGRRSRSPTRRSRSPNRRAKSPGRRSRSPPTKSTQEKKFSTSGDRRRSVSPKTRFAEKPGSRERPRESRDTSSKHVHEAESSRYSKASGGEDDQRSGNRPSLLPINKNAEKALYDGGAHRRPSPVRKDVARPPPSDHHEHPRSRSPVSRNDRPPTRTQSAEGRLAGFGSRRDHPREDRHGFYVTASEKNAVKAGLSQDRPMREVGECAPIRNVSPPHRGRGVIRQTSTTLHERFSLAQGVSTRSAFVPPEQITIGIERNIPGNEPTVMRSEFRPEDVVVIRRKDEGVCPFYERQEFQTCHDEEQYNERRVVKIVRPNVLPRGDKGMSKFEREYQMKNFEVQSNQLKMEPDSCTGDRVTLSDRWGVVKRDPEVLCSHAVENVIHRRHDVTVIDTHDRLPDSRTGGTARDERMLSNKRFSSSGEFGEYDRFQPDPNDLRHNLVVRRRTGGPEPSDSRYRLGRSDDGEFHRQREVIQQRGLMDRRGAVIGGKPRLTSLVGHAEVGARSMDTRSVLPDFSKRENKYDYQAWEDHPEMIPRGSSYFEHDNRDDFNYRGRRGFGRGPFRGGGRGRGMGRRDFVASEPTWKHDKYQEIEEEEDDNKPTSTT